MTSALRSPVFVRVLVAGFVSDTGDWMLFIALPLLAYRVTGSALGTSVAFVLELVPVIVLAPVAARLIARFDRRRLLVAVSIAQAIALTPLLFVGDARTLPLLYCVIVLQASCAAIFEPAKDSWLPDLVERERLVSANALVGLAQNIGRLVGGPLGGALLAFGRLDVIVIADAASYLIAAALIWSAPRRRGTASDAAHEGTSSDELPKHGVLSALRQPGLRAAYASAGLAAVAQGLFLVLFVLFVTERLGGSDAEVGLLRGIQAVGSIAAGAALGFASTRIAARGLATAGALTFGAVSLAIWNLAFVTTAPWVYVVLFIVVGAPGVLLTTGFISMIQTVAVDRGAAFAAFGLVSAVGQGAGLLLAGTVQSQSGLVIMLDVQGTLYVLAGAALLVRRRGRARRGGPLSNPASPDRRLIESASAARSTKGRETSHETSRGAR